MGMVTELVRLVAGIAGGAMFVTLAVVLVHWKALPYGRAQKFRYLSLALYGFLSAISQATQLSKPLVWYRTPILIAATFCGLYGVYRDWWIQGWKSRKFPEFTPNVMFGDVVPPKEKDLP